MKIKQSILLLAGFLFVQGLWSLSASADIASCKAAAKTVIEAENCETGDPTWVITNPRCATCPNNVPSTGVPSGFPVLPITADALYGDVEIQGYASKASINKGESIGFFVSTRNPATYSIKVYRVGYYGGAGARLMKTFSGLVGTRKPVPVYVVPEPYVAPAPIECDWGAASATILTTETSEWVSGVYLAKLEITDDQTVPTTNNKQSYIIFVIRDDNGPAAHLYTTSDTTYQAYNEWGGASLYTVSPYDGGDLWSSPTKKNGVKVSYNRPYWRNNGAGEFLSYEIDMVRWLEKTGQDVTYASDVDLHADSSLLLGRKSLLTVGHSEYWSAEMRANAERARERGTSLGFFAANTVYWQIRFENGAGGVPNRTIVGYKESAFGKGQTGVQDPYFADADPSNDRFIASGWSSFKRNNLHYPNNNLQLDPINQSEEALLGVQYSGGWANDPQAISIDNTSNWPNWLKANLPVTPPFNMTGMLGYEVDQMEQYYPSNILLLARSNLIRSGTSFPGDLTIYTAPSGANVLASGSIHWQKGLNPDATVPAADTIMQNFLNQAAGLAPRPTVRPPIGKLRILTGAPTSVAIDLDTGTSWSGAEYTVDLGRRKQINSVNWIGTATAYTIQVSDAQVSWREIANKSTCAQNCGNSEPVNAQGRYVRISGELSFDELQIEGSEEYQMPLMMAVSSENGYLGLDDADFGLSSDADGESSLTAWNNDGSFNQLTNFSVKPWDIIVSPSWENGYICWLDSIGISCYSSVNGAAPPVVIDGIKLAGSQTHACVLGATSGVQCWGDNTFSQLNVPPLVSQNQPSDIAVGVGHSCAIDSVGVHCWGDNTSAQAPATVTLQANDVPLRIAAGDTHGCVIVANGGSKAVRCWGDPNMPSSPNSTSKIVVPGTVTSPLRIAAGANHTCVVDGDYKAPENLKVICWGDGGDYQTQVPENGLLGRSPVDIEAGANGTCAALAGEDTAVDAMVCWPVNLTRNLDETLGVPPDSDSDGISDFDEVTLGTNPLASDTDVDGVTDFYDKYPLSVAALANDLDRDGALDSQALNPIQDTDGFTRYGSRGDSLTPTSSSPFTYYSLWGTSVGQTISGQGGSDYLYGMAGNDILNGNSGDDVIDGGDGNDTINCHGHSSGDRVSYAFSVSAVTINLNTGVNSGGAGVDTISNCENLTGSSFGDSLTGNGSANKLDGGLGDDTLSGLGGNDTLNGDDGNDIITGGTNTDTMSGGAGIDRFVFNALSETAGSTGSADNIMDFVSGEDKVDLSSITGTFTFVTGSFSAANQVRFISTAPARLEINTNSDITNVERFIKLNMTAEFVESDLIP